MTGTQIGVWLIFVDWRTVSRESCTQQESIGRSGIQHTSKLVRIHVRQEETGNRVLAQIQNR